MRLSTLRQRAYIADHRLAILYRPEDVAWILSALDAAYLPASIMVQEPPQTRKHGRSTVSIEDDGEGRIAVVRRRLFGNLDRTGRKYFNVAGTMTGSWTREHGGFGWVDMQL